MCLLNRVLTDCVRARRRRTEAGALEGAVPIGALVAHRNADGSRTTVAILWGKDAQSLTPRLPRENADYRVPAPVTRHIANGRFSRADD